MSENKHTRSRNILLYQFGELHADIRDYLADDIVVRAWVDKPKYPNITHDMSLFYRALKPNKKTNNLSIQYRYRKEFLLIHKELAQYANTFMYIHSRRPTLNGENNFIDMMDAFHIYIHFFIDLLKTNDIHCVFFAEIPHHADFLLYLVTKALGVKTVLFNPSEEPGKSFISTDINEMGSLADNTDNLRPISIKQKERKQYHYMAKPKIDWRSANTRIFSALLFRRDIDLFFHRLMNIRKRRSFRQNYKKMVRHNLPSGKFVYFPLHLQPEMTTQSLGGAFVDQLLAIECLRALLPDEWHIIAKENPKQSAQARGALFFARLAKIPHTVYLDKSSDTFDLLEKCEFCATITGTAGFEALTFGKRALIFGQAFYKNLPGVIQYRDDLTLDDVMSVHFSHDELEIAYAKLVANMVDVITVSSRLCLVKNFNKEKNTRALAQLISQAARE